MAGGVAAGGGGEWLHSGGGSFTKPYRGSTEAPDGRPDWGPKRASIELTARSEHTTCATKPMTAAPDGLKRSIEDR